MRTLIIVLAGLAVAALGLRLTPPGLRMLVGALFTVAWLAATLLNLRTGLSHGYTLAQELPIHALIFSVPVAAYWLYVWLNRHG
jgi:hypothetical protein